MSTMKTDEKLEYRFYGNAENYDVDQLVPPGLYSSWEDLVEHIPKTTGQLELLNFFNDTGLIVRRFVPYPNGNVVMFDMFGSNAVETVDIEQTGTVTGLYSYPNAFIRSADIEIWD